MSALLDELNPAQRQAVELLNGPLLILAGAGSGKTRVLTYRIANLILQGEATPGEIFAVTFTNKAAKEMIHRVSSLLDRMQIPRFEDLWVSTFHSSCARILREQISHLGYQSHFVIYDDSDQNSILKKIIQEMNLNDKMYPPKKFISLISQAKMLGLKPEDVPKKSFQLMDSMALEIYQHYENELFRANALDFDDLLMKTVELFKKHPEVLETYQKRFQYILVDEYQDTNAIQYELIKILGEKTKNVCVVGDEDQSIYSWRGADIQNILNFEKDFPEAQVIMLEQNYRSSANIVEAASFVIRNNSQRKDKKLFTENPPGSLITIQSEPREYEEARFVARKIEELVLKNGYSYNDFAIFYRTNAQSRVIEETLRSYAIPYRLVGSVRFYDRAEIKDLVCYLRLLLNSNDDLAFYRVINAPTRGIGKTTIEAIEETARKNKISAFEAALKTALERKVHSGACQKIHQFLNLIAEFKAALADKKLSEVYLMILDKTQYVQRLKDENTTEASARIDNLQELQNAIEQFESERDSEATLSAFLEELALITDADKLTEDAQAVTMMTLHLSKGLEYKNVFVVGLEEGLFPSGASTSESKSGKLEEERRLFYVGITRARENLFLSYALSRRVWGHDERRPPSRFLEEIPDRYVTGFKPKVKSSFLERYVDRYGMASDSEMNIETQNIMSLKKTSQQKSFGAAKSATRPVLRRPSFNQEAGETSTNRTLDSSEPASLFSKGDRVRHAIFGVGSIREVEGEGDLQKVSVLFHDKSVRKFVVKLARLEKV